MNSSAHSETTSMKLVKLLAVKHDSVTLKPGEEEKMIEVHVNPESVSFLTPRSGQDKPGCLINFIGSPEYLIVRYSQEKLANLLS